MYSLEVGSSTGRSSSSARMGRSSCSTRTGPRCASSPPFLNQAMLNFRHSQVWRHSTLSNFHLFPLTSSSPRALPLFSPSYPPKTFTAHFSPTSHHLAFVHENDLCVLPAGEWDAAEREGGEVGERAVRVTKEGSRVRMSGRPPWVYEEEVSRLFLPSLSFSETDEEVIDLLLRLDPLLVPFLVVPRFPLVQRIRRTNL